MKRERTDRYARARRWARLLVLASVFLSPPSRDWAQGEEAGQTGPPPGPAAAAGKAFPEILAEPQRIFLAWSEKEFTGEVDRSRFAGFPETEKKKLETKWLLDLERPKTGAYLEAINCLGAIGSQNAAWRLLRIAVDEQAKDQKERWMAVRALGMIGHESAVPECIHLLYHYNVNTRFWAQITLARITGQNFGPDWRKWGEWWNAQGKEPQFSPKKIAWTSDPEQSSEAWIERQDSLFIERLRSGEFRAHETESAGQAQGTVPEITGTDLAPAAKSEEGEKAAGAGAVRGLEGTLVLKYDDGTAEGQRSLGASGHAAMFKRPSNARFVEAVDVFAGRYGQPQAPKEDFYVYLLNDQGQVLSKIPYPYGTVERTDLRWYTLRTPSIEVTEQFAVVLSFNPSQTKGVYLGLDESVGESHSFAGLPDGGFKPVDGRFDWMVRVRLSEQPSSEKGAQRLADWKPPVKSDPFADCVEVKYDAGESQDKESYGGSGPAVLVQVRDSLPAGAPFADYALKGFRLYAERYGSGYDPDTTTVKVSLLDSTGQARWTGEFPYSLFSPQASWVDLVLQEPVSLANLVQNEGAMAMAFDPKADQTKGVYFHYNKNPQTSHSFRGTAEKRFEPTSDREWIIRAYFQKGAGAAAVSPAAEPGAPPKGPPRVVTTSPALGAKDADPSLREVEVTFDRDMRETKSWVDSDSYCPPIPEGRIVIWRASRTCLLPVDLEPGCYYRIAINLTSEQNFRSADKERALPFVLYFTTKGAAAQTIQRMEKPEVVETAPADAAENVDPSLKELRVTFSMPMRSGFSWVGSGPLFPKAPGGARIDWTEDRRTCVLPVQLQPNWKYRVGLNDASSMNFQSESGVPLDPVVLTFATGAGAGGASTSGPEESARGGAPVYSAPIVLQHDDGAEEDSRSIAGGGHAVRFECPSEGCILSRVQLFGSRYGQPEAPNRDFEVNILDANARPVRQSKRPYGIFKRGAAKWRTIETDGIPVPKTFWVAFDFDPSKTQGVYVSIDTSNAGSFSRQGTLASGFTDLGPNKNWMIRAVVKERMTTAHEEKEAGPSLTGLLQDAITTGVTTPTAAQGGEPRR